MKTTHVGIKFNTTSMTPLQLSNITKAREALNEAGIVFGNGKTTNDNGDVTGVIWDFDFDLSGPVEVELRAFDHHKRLK